jgi:hypothetical protein
VPDGLGPEPAVLTGAKVGYARVSTTGQLLDRQQRALTDAGCARVFADKLPGRTAERPELAAGGAGFGVAEGVLQVAQAHTGAHLGDGGVGVPEHVRGQPAAQRLQLRGGGGQPA